MFDMRPWSLIWLASVGCHGRLPLPGEIAIHVKATTRVEARIPTSATVAVALEGSPVPEFFGVPLDNAQDVIFVLDVSGSMADPAQGRIAQIHTTQPPPSGPPGPPPPPPPNSGPPGPPPVVDPSIPNGLPPPADPATPTTTSASPPPRKIDVAQAELVDALQRLPAGTRMNVIFFNSGLEAFAPSIVALDDPNRATLVEFVRETEPVGSTALAPAMRTAFVMNAKRIVLLSDGLGNVGGNAQSLIRDAREAIRGGVRIDTVGLGAGQDIALLSTLASESGGIYQPL